MFAKKSLTFAALAAALLLPEVVRTQSKPAVMKLTDLDYIEIRQLVNRYPFAVDTGNNNGYDYADLFSADGEFMRPYSKGREALAKLARGGRLGPSNVVHYITNHVIEPTADGAIGKEYLFELTFNPAQRGQAPPAANAGGGAAPPAGPAPNAAAAAPPAGRGQGGGGGRNVNQWDMIGRKNGELARTGGHYEDVYVKTSEGWRFKKRDFIPSKRGANPAPLNPPRIPEDADKGIQLGPLPPANFVAPTRQTTLTALDYLQIEQLVSSYGHALDSGYGKGENGEAYASLYTPEAAFGGAVGHDQLAALARVQPRGPDYVRHYLTNHVIEPTAAGGVRGKQYLVVFDINENAEPGTIYLGGHYEDTYVKTAEGWRIKTRVLFGARPGPQTPAANNANAAPAATAAAATTQAPPRNTRDAKVSLTAADYLEIKQLVARASYALDQVAAGGESYARLYTTDGVYKVKGSSAPEVKGRQKLAAFVRADVKNQGPVWVHDYVTNHIIQPAGQGATGSVYVVGIEIAEAQNPGAIQTGGRYEDVYQKTPEGWRIKSRTYVPVKLGPRPQ